jgi:membrane associated rhomboid family serine protease
MITPVKVVNGWETALGGNLSSDVLATLATTLTAGFLHADGSHLGGNMLFLWLFGVVVCELCGLALDVSCLSFFPQLVDQSASSYWIRRAQFRG